MSTRNLSYDELDDFSKNVIDEMESLTNDRGEALRIYNTYLPVFELLVDEYLEDDAFYAEQFYEADQAGYPVADWISKIEVMCDKKAVKPMEEVESSKRESSAGLGQNMIVPSQWDSNVLVTTDKD